ncbi:hypothetical protein [Paracoccus shanxieyensis]|uniref:Uncharacterized protein n=1 Tax=Paracoccus shanxieyensis TaxID=2675752 RepID=A0A6L6IWI9_9RHOB|nr:hypothetical protein [Paracoccus shanxieyensis]MTH64876.1 hypothetical protein [Paracoccus shanxieyensis]MTH87891.1 hypothetical protein [Paracoccus shanxieyensis]
MKYLRDQGMDVALLRKMHQSNTETFGAAISYRHGNPYRVFNGPNITYHRRLLFVAAEHWRTGTGFQELTEAAIERFDVSAR